MNKTSLLLRTTQVRFFFFWAFPRVSKDLKHLGQTTSLIEQSSLVLRTHGLISREF